jgi:hypothetical protein
VAEGAVAGALWVVVWPNLGERSEDFMSMKSVFLFWILKNLASKETQWHGYYFELDCACFSQDGLIAEGS